MAKAAILIDGGYFLKRLPIVRPDIDSADPEAVAGAVRSLIEFKFPTSPRVKFIVPVTVELVAM